MMPSTDLPWIFVASASKFSYSSLETLYLDYQFACSKFGLEPDAHVRISQVADDEFRLCISMKLSELVDENLDAFTRPVAELDNDLPLSSAKLPVSSV